MVAFVPTITDCLLLSGPLPTFLLVKLQLRKRSAAEGMRAYVICQKIAL